MIGEKLQKATESYSLQMKADKANRKEKDRTEKNKIENNHNRRGTGVAIATLTGSASMPSSSYSSNDVQPLLMLEEIPDEVFVNADISRDIVTDVILHFCRRHREVLNSPCPMIDSVFAVTIPGMIVNLIDQNTGEILFDSDKWNSDSVSCTQWYMDMIDKYFSTEFTEGCNYSLQHFFSGNIRVLRYHEVGRMPYEF